MGMCIFKHPQRNKQTYTEDIVEPCMYNYEKLKCICVCLTKLTKYFRGACVTGLILRTLRRILPPAVTSRGRISEAEQVYNDPSLKYTATVKHY